ncbi:MAG: chitobiase/beta-hexosaminidase C-terminal domain-containing protein, partial [Prevotella sp.]|nr:chitobiase/beta-hexosaminidase C-terminal domain-containing protein [Prevotella sp.]
MRKLFTLITLAFLTSLGADAQVRKTWDFSKGVSEETRADLDADPSWIIDATDTETGRTTRWKDGKKMSGTLMANGNVIKELEHLQIGTAGLKNDNNMLIQQSVFRVTRANMEIILPKLANGQKITMIARSANGTATNRGFKGNGNMTYIDGPEGGICLGGAGDQTLVWEVKAPGEDSVEVKIILMGGGCDITSIIIDEGDAPEVEDAYKVAYITNPATVDEDMAHIFLSSATDKVNLTTIDAASNVTLDSLYSYKAVVVSPYVKATDAMAPVLKSAIAYEPMLNLNTSLYEAWGLGKAVATEATGMTVAETAKESFVFNNIDTEAPIELLSGNTLTGVAPAAYFAADDTLATAGEVLAMHQHNADRNSYLLIPLNEENIASVNADIIGTLVTNAAVTVARTKKDVVPTGAPTITQENKNMETVVTMKTTNKNATIYYTTDGKEPTTASSVYTEPFTLTEACTVNAIATLDGYLQSKMVSADIAIMAQAATPTIAIEKNADNSVVTLSCATEGAEIYYCYTPITDKAKAQKYEAPITLSTEPTEIYAFATAENHVQSGLASDYVAINSINANTIRIDTLAHFDCNPTDWFLNDTENGGDGNATTYYFWGKKAWNYYTDEVDHTETVKDSQGNDSTVYYYKPDPNAVKVAIPLNDNGWVIKSAGQALVAEFGITPEKGVSNGELITAAETPDDLIGGLPTKGELSFKGKSGSDPYTGSIETTGKYAAPFDVVVYCGNGKGTEFNLQIQVSTDGLAWDSIGKVAVAKLQRNYKKTRVSHETAGEYYVRVAQVGGSSDAKIYDIYILNNGENSKKYDASTVGIDNVNNASELVRSEIFSVNGVRRNA